MKRFSFLLNRFFIKHLVRAAVCWMAALALAGCTEAGMVMPIVRVNPAVPVPPSSFFATPVPVPTPVPVLVSPADLNIDLDGPLTVGLETGLPEELTQPVLAVLHQVAQVEAANGTFPLHLLDEASNAQVQVALTPWRSANIRLAERFFAVVVPFATVEDEITLEELQLRWGGAEDSAPVFATVATTAQMHPLLGDFAGVEVPADALLQRLEETPGALGVLPFDEIDPRFKVLAVDGVDVLSNEFDPNRYPLAVALTVRGKGAPLVAQLIGTAIQPWTNRNAGDLTTLIMTGVTAISRGTAAAIERTHLTYPADVISDTLAAADITHISNEVPFLDDCVVNNTENNIVLCSHTDYLAVLEAVGTDIVGLSGNHVNDFGYDGARESLTFYREKGIPIYGSGMNIEEACAPLQWEHQGNTFAFIAALAYWPESAWATEDLPGACYYYDHKEMLLAMVEELAQTVDIVSVELQYYETYEPFPTGEQVLEFREIRAAGADIVTGVQSHVPQAVEPYGNHDPMGQGIIVYGLGNLFFDQMWSWQTRTELIARHIIYQGRLLNTQILTAVLEDFAQPRWATPEERRDILTRIFNAAPVRP